MLSLVMTDRQTDGYLHNPEIVLMQAEVILLSGAFKIPMHDLTLEGQVAGVDICVLASATVE